MLGLTHFFSKVAAEGVVGSPPKIPHSYVGVVHFDVIFDQNDQLIKGNTVKISLSFPPKFKN